MMMCCKKLDLKNMESTDYYRNSLEAIIPRRRDFEEDDYTNYPPRSQVGVDGSAHYSAVSNSDFFFR